MKLSHWVGTSALVAVLACGASAEAKTLHHKRHTPAASAEERELKAEVDTLKDQVATLQARLDAQDKAQQQAALQVQAAQAQADAAKAQAQSAQERAEAAASQVQTLPEEVHTEVAKATPKPGWWGSTKVGGTVYADASWARNEADGVEQPGSGPGFDIKRFYVTVDHSFNSVWSANMTTDFTYDSGPASATQLYIKKAYLQAKLSPAFIVRIGSADLPWIPFVENIYGYRYVENTLIDRTKYGTSADWGVHILGDLDGGLFSYAFSVVNGAGYKKPDIGPVNRTNSIDVEGRVSAHYAGFTAAVGGYSGKLGHDVVGAPTYATAERVDALVAYVDPRFRIGGEYFWARDWNDVTQATPTLRNDSDGWSAFGSFNFTPKIAIFGRYDWVHPKKDTAPSLVDHYFNIGVSYEPVSAVDLALVYKRDSVDNGLISTSNGTIGGVYHGTYDEVGLFTQFKF
ncbi:MAG TPA: hypothetical protein VGS12_02255 [Caulobacteraceae bacterium]|nr:hypothetical protein [Caulobacteraceae bacterium]